MLDFGAQIHDGARLPPVPSREAADIDALRNLFIVGQRAVWQLAVSPYTELFCTRDWTTILKHRTELTGLPIEIVTPAEWWAKIRPYAGLW
jgi:hypothetical protein